MNQTTFTGPGVQLVRANVTFDSTDSDFMGGQFMISDPQRENLDAGILGETFVTDAPVLHIDSNNSRVFEVALNKSLVEPGRTYQFYIAIAVDPVNATPVKFKPTVMFWSGYNGETRPGSISGTAVTPPDMLPPSTTYSSATVWENPNWTYQNIEGIGGRLEPVMSYSAPESSAVMFHFNARHTGDYSPVAGTTGTAATRLWDFTTGGFGADPSPTIANGTVYIGSDDRNFYALNATTGAQVWTNTTGYTIASTPAIYHGTVYFGSEDHYVYALNASTGAEIWTYNTGAYIYSSPTVANNTVYIADDTVLHALDATTGTQLWSRSLGSQIYPIPAVANDVLYIGNTNRVPVRDRGHQRITALELHSRRLDHLFPCSCQWQRLFREWDEGIRVECGYRDAGLDDDGSRFLCLVPVLTGNRKRDALYRGRP